VKCAHTHPLITIGDEKLQIQGGSCYSPQGFYDIEILLCSGGVPSKMLPWWNIQFVLYPIVDMSVPKDIEEFNQLLDWTIEQMRAKKKVHVGCIGGHGRTGTFLAALINRITGETDTITWLRKNYCTSAVESKEQIDWLHEHYGIKKVKATKSWGGHSSYSSYSSNTWDKNKVSKLAFGNAASGIAIPLPNRSVWGDTKII
jgi:hypothetical protein